MLKRWSKISSFFNYVDANFHDFLLIAPLNVQEPCIKPEILNRYWGEKQAFFIDLCAASVLELKRRELNSRIASFKRIVEKKNNEVTVRKA